MTGITVKSRAHRALRQLSRFTSREHDLAQFVTRLRLKTDEDIVGVYRNPAESLEPDVVISSRGLHLVGREITESVFYSEIQSMTGPTEKMEADRIVLDLQKGQTMVVPILGRDGRFRDVFAFQRFLDRVLADAG